MKKSLLIAAALFAAFTINAKEITIDLSQYNEAGASASLEAGVLTVSYDLGEWEDAGVIFDLDNLDVTNIAFDYKGDESVENWVSFIVYLEDSEGGQWYSEAADLSISEWNAEWASKSFMPSDVLWESSEASEPIKPFVALGFLANPVTATAATFAIRNVVITYNDETAVSNIEAQSKTTKVIRDGKMVILRDGKTYNALGTQLK